MDRLDRDQAAVVGLYTATKLGPDDDLLTLAEALLGRPVTMSELRDDPVLDQLRELVKPAIVAIGANEIDDPPNWTADATPALCPDAGACHHSCVTMACWRVANAEPLSGVFVDDEWPAPIKAAFGG